MSSKVLWHHSNNSVICVDWQKLSDSESDKTKKVLNWSQSTAVKFTRKHKDKRKHKSMRPA